jgi:hypothetical protein
VAKEPLSGNLPRRCFYIASVRVRRTWSTYLCPFNKNVAVTVALPFKTMAQVREAPEQLPDQPPNTEPGLGIAVRLTVVPTVKTVPVGLLATVPPPVPFLITDSVYVATTKVALIAWFFATFVKV